MTLRKVDIAEHLDMTERNLHDVLKKLELDHREASLDEIRIAYIRDLRKTAAGHSDRLTSVRIQREEQELIRLTRLNEREEKVLIPTEELAPGLELYVYSLFTEMMSISEKLKPMIDQQYSIDFDADLISDELFEALDRLSRSFSGHASAATETV